ncbi:MAG TPA: TMEM175 family protein [Candidatus Udaeobacter sp.]|jgi:uncharacterized membrane protein|nr:TMEM175 family protein [Candidatus Udaeobacter sp.]
MTRQRLEAFSDGVIAILITIMVLELHMPPGADLASLKPVVPGLLAYVLSFIFLGIYWNNHHHTFHLVDRINGAMLWANLHVLFWLSLIPVTTAWVGAHPTAALPSAIYGAVLLMAGVAYFILIRVIIAFQGEHSRLAAAIGADIKGIGSVLLYASAIPLAFVRPWIAQAIYVIVALIWLVPDPRIESRIER